MTQLITKLQYKNCEPGEFFNIGPRTFEETIEQIKAYPWVVQRENASVYYTGPSVSVENHSGGILKLSHYYSGKFCLYLMDSTGVVSRSIILKLEDSYPIIQDFFNDKNIAYHFSSLSFVSFARKHFVTNRFEYNVTPGRIFQFLSFPEIFYIILLSAVFVRGALLHNSFITSFIGFLFAILFMTGFNFYLFFNYYFFSKNLYLRISGGHVHFLFGTKDNPFEYSKDDIERITLYHNKGRKCPWGNYYVFEIHFTNGNFIQFPNLLISETTLLGKLQGKKTEEVHEFLATCLKSKLTD